MVSHLVRGICIVGLSAGSVCAQTNDMFGLELNAAKPTAANGCQLTFVAVNKTGIPLSQTDFEVGVFEADGAFSRLLKFEFGAFPVNKTKVVQFILDKNPCPDISRLLINNVLSCRGPDGEYPVCMDKLAPKARVDMEFGL